MKKTKTRERAPAKARITDSPLDALSEPVRGTDANAKPGLIKLNEIVQKGALTAKDTAVSLELRTPQADLPKLMDEAMQNKEAVEPQQARPQRKAK